MRLRLVKEPFDNPDYIFELKHDGFRALAYIDAGECRLVSRNLKSLRFVPVAHGCKHAVSRRFELFGQCEGAVNAASKRTS